MCCLFRTLTFIGRRTDYHVSQSLLFHLLFFERTFCMGDSQFRLKAVLIYLILNRRKFPSQPRVDGLALDLKDVEKKFGGGKWKHHQPKASGQLSIRVGLYGKGVKCGIRTSALEFCVKEAIFCSGTSVYLS